MSTEIPRAAQRNVDAVNAVDIDAVLARQSLKRLKTDPIDLFYQHRVDPNVP